MTETKTARETILSTTNFIHCGDDYLFIHRTKKGNSVDFGRLNGIGGKVEPGETFVACAIRETLEETGYEVPQENCQLRAVVNLSGGYAQDWMMCFFSMTVETKNVPLGMENPEGNLLWLPASQVLTSGYELVDDLQYIWTDLVEDSRVLFFAAQLNKQEKITQHSIFHL